MDAASDRDYPAGGIAAEGRVVMENPTPPPAEVSPSLRKLGKAIANHPNPVKVMYCGFDLWIEVMSSDRTKPRNFTTGGKLATGDEDKTTLTVPIMVVGDAIVINFDPTLPPDGFRLGP
jgi:hypothetical protein